MVQPVRALLSLILELQFLQVVVVAAVEQMAQTIRPVLQEMAAQTEHTLVAPMIGMALAVEQVQLQMVPEEQIFQTKVELVEMVEQRRVMHSPDPLSITEEEEEEEELQVQTQVKLMEPVVTVEIASVVTVAD